MKACLLIIVIMSWPSLADAKERDGLDRPWWRIVAITRESDGGVSVELELRLPYKMDLIENIEAYGARAPWRRDKEERKSRPLELHKLYPSVEDGRVILAVRSGRTEQVEIWARVKTKEHIDFAGIAYNSYGKAPPGDTGPEPLAAAPDWPALTLVMGPNFYRAQSGADIVLRPSHGFIPDSVTVYKDGRLSAYLRAENGKYIYTPPHDAELSKAGSATWKNLVFLARQSDRHESVTFGLPLYRSHYGNINLPGGLLVVFIGALGAFAVVLLMNRAFRWR